MLGTAILAAITWIAVIFFDRELLLLFGAEETLLPLARRYVLPVKFAVPSFLFTQLMSAFLRNDGAPGLATKAVILGGIFNVFGDYFFVFVMDFGIFGAGLATVLGSIFLLIIMCTHFFNPKNTLHFVKPNKLIGKLKSIIVTGFSTFFIDVVLPAIAPAESIWFAMPITELIVAIFVVTMIVRYTKELVNMRVKNV